MTSNNDQTSNEQHAMQTIEMKDKEDSNEQSTYNQLIQQITNAHDVNDIQTIVNSLNSFEDIKSLLINKITQSPLCNEPKEQTIINNSENDITKESLKQLRQQQKVNGYANEHYTLEVLHILGGIDFILDYHLSSKDSILSEKQLQDIHKILTTSITKTDTIQKQSQLAPLSSTKHLFPDQNNDLETTSNDATFDKFYYTFYTSDTFLHQMFSRKLARKLINITYSRWWYIFMAGIIGGWGLLIIIFGIGKNILVPLWGIFMNGFFIPTEIFVILSSNRKAFALVIKSFEFWFKCLYAVFCGILVAIYYANLPVLTYRFLTTLEVVLLVVFTLPLFITGLSLFDAVHLNKLSKLTITLVVAVVCTGFSFYFQFLTTNPDVFLNITSTHSFSMLSTISSALRVLSIFVWKQFWNTLRKQSKGKCVMIKYTPYMKWINDDNMSKAITMGIIDTNIQSQHHGKTKQIQMHPLSK